MTTTSSQDYGTTLSPLRLSARIMPADIYIGILIRLRRKELHLSQAKLGKKIGVSSQQMQKYESGANRISVGRFILLCRTLKVDPAYFFDSLPPAVSV